MYGDFASGQVWLANNPDGGQCPSRLWGDTEAFISSFDKNEQGHPHIADYLGRGAYRFASVIFESRLE